MFDISSPKKFKYDTVAKCPPFPHHPKQLKTCPKISQNLKKSQNSPVNRSACFKIIVKINPLPWIYNPFFGANFPYFPRVSICCFSTTFRPRGIMVLTMIFKKLAEFFWYFCKWCLIFLFLPWWGGGELFRSAFFVHNPYN